MAFLGRGSLRLRQDAELAARASVGDAQAYGELARRHGPAVTGLLRRLGANGPLAEDLTQDAFLTGFEKLGMLHDPAAFRGWIKRIAARLYVRRARRDARLELMADPPEPDAAPSSLEQHAVRMALETALESLSPAQRLCIGLCYGADLSHEEVAHMLNIPLGTAKSHVKRGLEALRRRMGASEGSFADGGS